MWVLAPPVSFVLPGGGERAAVRGGGGGGVVGCGFAGPAPDEQRVRRVNAHRCNDLRLTGSGGANRVMEAELKRLVMRSPFHVRLEKPKREGEATLLYPFDARVAWVAACYHRTSSRISWDSVLQPGRAPRAALRRPLPALSPDDRLPEASVSASRSTSVPRRTSKLRRSSFVASSRMRSSRRWRREASRPNSMAIAGGRVRRAPRGNA